MQKEILVVRALENHFGQWCSTSDIGRLTGLASESVLDALFALNEARRVESMLKASRSLYRLADRRHRELAGAGQVELERRAGFTMIEPQTCDHDRSGFDRAVEMMMGGAARLLRASASLERLPSRKMRSSSETPAMRERRLAAMRRIGIEPDEEEDRASPASVAWSAPDNQASRKREISMRKGLLRSNQAGRAELAAAQASASHHCEEQPRTTRGRFMPKSDGEGAGASPTCQGAVSVTEASVKRYTRALQQQSEGERVSMPKGGLAAYSGLEEIKIQDDAVIIQLDRRVNARSLTISKEMAKVLLAQLERILRPESTSTLSPDQAITWTH